MLAEIYRKMLTKTLVEDKDPRLFFKMVDDQFAWQFAEGPKGWGLYKEIATIVMEGAPEHVEEFQRRYAKNVDKDAIVKEEFGSHQNLADEFLKSLKETAAEDEAENKKRGLLGRLFKK